MSYASEFRQVRQPSHAPPDGPPPASRSDTPHDLMVRADILPGTRHPFAKAFACAGGTWAIATGLLALLATPHAAAEGVPSGLLHATANASLLLAIPSASLAVVTGLIVYASQQVWPLWRIALAFLSLFLLMVVFLIIGAASL